MTGALRQADVVYREDARSYRSLAWSPLLIPVLFGADLLVSGRRGALVHLPGWVVFGAILVGIQWLLLHAVRATHSLYVTSDEVVVGDEAIPRAEIAGVTTGRAADPELPTLGWPNGFPRASPAVTVRLADGRDVLVPTRFPELVRDVLAIGAPETNGLIEIRVAAAADLAEVPTIDERAETIFRVAGYARTPHPVDGAELAAARLVLVVDDPPVGYAWVADVDGQAHLRGLAVLPGAMRRGHGSRLLEAACTWAAEQAYPAMTVTTLADVPWNGPFFAARGFVVEDDQGRDTADRRVVMCRPLA